MAIKIGTILNHSALGLCVVSKIDICGGSKWVWFHKLAQKSEEAVWQTEDEMLADPKRYRICGRDPTSLKEGDRFLHKELGNEICLAEKVDKHEVSYRLPKGSRRCMTYQSPGPGRNDSLRRYVRAILTPPEEAPIITTPARAEPESIFPPWR